MNRRMLAILLLLLITFISGDARLTRTASASKAFVQAASQTSKTVATVPFELINRHIVLQLKVNNSRPLSFILDTGDQYAIIDLERAKELKLNMRGQVNVGGAGASLQKGAFVQDASFVIQDLPGFSQPVTMALPLGSLSPRMGRDFDGILGSEFIKEFVVEIDYQARLLKLHDKSSFSYTGKGESIPIILSHGHPLLDAEVTPVGGQPLKGKFVLDIGAGLALALYSPFVVGNNLLSESNKTIDSLGGAGAGGETHGRVGRVSELKIGSFSIKSPITLFSQDKAGAFASSALAGNIGARIANKFRVFLDYGRLRIILEPNSSFGAAYDYSQSGLSLVAEGVDYRSFRVRNLLPNSPASEAGLRKDDVIVSVNGQAASSLTLSQLNEMFERPVAYKLTVRRGEETLNVTLTPRRLV
jgi:hypothetical protein